MKALTDTEVGRYLNEHFVSSHLKVGTFQLLRGKKVGGNIASYFTQADGTVLHVVPGPVDASTLLGEARWVVEAHKLAAALSHGNDTRYKEFIARAHKERLQREYGVSPSPQVWNGLRTPSAFTEQGNGVKMFQRLNNQGRVHLLLGAQPLAPVDQIYEVVFEQVLGEKVSLAPVARR